MEVARVAPTFWPVRRRRPKRVPFGGRDPDFGGEPGVLKEFERERDIADWSSESYFISWLAGEWLRSRCCSADRIGLKVLPTLTKDSRRLSPLLGLSRSLRGPCAESLKMWTVSLAEETQRRVEAGLNVMLYMFAGIEPRRNW